MYNIKIITIGKTREEWLSLALDEYEKRMISFCKIEWILVKNLEDLEKILDREKFYICLDILGESFSSDQFSHYLLKNLQDQKSRIIFVIGGAEGLSEKIKKKANTSISLSKLTYTHQMSRLILIEQIYRAFEIDKGSKYHK